MRNKCAIDYYYLLSIVCFCVGIKQLLTYATMVHVSEKDGGRS